MVMEQLWVTFLLALYLSSSSQKLEAVHSFKRNKDIATIQHFSFDHA